MSDVLSDITVQSISAFIGGGAVAVIPPLVQLVSKRRRSSDAAGTKAQATAGPGAAAVAAGDSINGDVDVKIDNSRSIVIENIHESNPRATKTDAQGWSDTEWLVVAAVVIAIGLFASYYVILGWFTIGISVGLLATAVSGAVRAGRWRLWDGKALLIGVEVVLSGIAAIWAWTAIFTSEHGGVSLEDIRGTVATEIAANPAPEGIAGVVASILSPTLMLFKVSFANGHLLFVISLFVGFVFSLIMLLLSWSRVLDWYAYMGFLYGTGSERSARRASRHVQLKSADVFWFFFFAAVTVVFASGLLASYLGEAPSMLTPGT